MRRGIAILTVSLLLMRRYLPGNATLELELSKNSEKVSEKEGKTTARKGNWEAR